MRFLHSGALSSLLIVVIATCASLVRAVPSGFSRQTIFDARRLNDIEFSSDERMFLIQKMGYVTVREPGPEYNYKDFTVLLDIEDITCYENERGLGGLALHPNFDSNNWM